MVAEDSPSDYERIAKLQDQDNKIRDILFFNSIHSNNKSTSFGFGRKTDSFGSKQGAETWKPLESLVTEVNELGNTTGVFDKLSIQSAAATVTGPVGTLIIKSIQHVLDGRLFTLTPGTGRTVELQTGGGAPDEGAALDIPGTIILTDKDMVIMQYQKDTDKVKVISSGVASATGTVPDGTVENEHLEWDNTAKSWNAVTSIAFNNNDATLATAGDGRFANGGTLAWRDGLAAQDMFFSFNSNQEWRFDSLTAGGSGFNIRENFLDMIEQQIIPTGTANTVKVYAKEDADTVTRLFYKDSANVENALGGATRALDNLLNVDINTSLIPNGSGVRNLGQSANYWRYGFLQAIDFKGDVTVGTFGTANDGISSDASGMWLNLGLATDDFRLYEAGKEMFKFQKFLTNVHEFHMGDSGTFTAGEEYRIQMGESSTSSARIFYIEGTGNDLILDRAGGGTTQGVQVRVAGLSLQRWLSDETKFFQKLNVDSQDIMNVKLIKSDGASTGVIGELTTGNGGFNYFVRNAIQWESDSALQIKFLSSGLVLESNGTSDDITFSALGLTSDIIGNATGDYLFTSTGINTQMKLTGMWFSTAIGEPVYVDNDDSTGGRTNTTGMFQSSAIGATPKVLDLLAWNETVFKGYGEATTNASRGVVLAYIASSDPTATEIPAGYFTVAKNTTGGAVKLWYNDSGTLKSVTLT